jgi:hypothetical protein
VGAEYHFFADFVRVRTPEDVAALRELEETEGWFIYEGGAAYACTSFVPGSEAWNCWSPTQDEDFPQSRQFGDRIALYCHSDSRTFCFRHWREGLLVRAFSFPGAEGRRDEWLEVCGEPEAWEEAFFFSDHARAKALQHIDDAMMDAQQAAQTRQDIERMWKSKRLANGERQPYFRFEDLLDVALRHHRIRVPYDKDRLRPSKYVSNAASVDGSFKRAAQWKSSNPPKTVPVVAFAGDFVRWTTIQKKSYQASIPAASVADAQPFPEAMAWTCDAWSSDGKLGVNHFATRGELSVTLRDAVTGVEIAKQNYRCRKFPVGFALSADVGRALAGNLYMDLRNGTVIAQLPDDWHGRRFNLRSNALSPDLKRACLFAPYMVKLYEISTGDELVCDLPQYSVHSAAFTPDSRELFLGSHGEISIVDIESGACVRRAQLDIGDVERCCIAPDGRWAVCSDDVRIVLLNVAEVKQVQVIDFPDTGDSLCSLAVAPDSSGFAAATANGVVTLWKA